MPRLPAEAPFTAKAGPLSGQGWPSYRRVRDCRDMHWQMAENQIPYTGKELRSGWIAQTIGLDGHAIVGFIGPCRVALENMVDQKDVQRGVGIRAALMLHFIAEHFDDRLPQAILRQRLLICLTGEILRDRQPDLPLRRSGDDLFVEDRKLSVSIATASPVSTLIHFALNIDPTDAPVPAIGLDELGIVPEEIAPEIMAAYVAEMESCEAACHKVRGVP